MRNRTTGILAASVIGASIISLAQDRTPKEESAELEVLNRYVGTWRHEAALLPSKSTPQGTTQRAVEQVEWTLGDSFLIGRAVNETTGLKSLSFFSSNRIARTYSFVSFGSNGMIGRMTGKWDKTHTTMTLAPTDLPPGWKGNATHKFSGDSYDCTMTFTNNSGETVMDRHDIRKRQAANVGQRMLDSWSEMATPSPSSPEELMRLAPLVGKWTETQSMRIPVKVEARNELTFEWILDGRFMFGTTTSSRDKLTRLRVIGFDTNSNEYRLVSFTTGGKISEALGRWDDKTGLVTWRMAQDPKGPTATWEFADDGSVKWHVIRKSDEKTVLDMMIRLERQNTRQ
jgi:hypothetical protein